MKLNYKRTLLVGFAFLSICAFWQLYDNVIPLILKNTFHMKDSLVGVVMAMDNVLALFLLPFFGKLSDKCHTKLGRRTPFILGGTAAAVILMNILPYADNHEKLLLFVIPLGLLLIAMGTYRSPAVALMPDVTPKPLRSKANAIINLMGALGGVFTLGVTGLLVHAGATGRNDYTMLFLAVSLLMAISVIVLVLTVRENKLAAEVAAMETDEEKEAEAEEKKESGKAFGELAPDVRRSLWLILFSVAFWFMGYNAVTSAFTRYMQVQWGYDIKAASLCLMVATVGAVLSYLPVGILSSKFGRKKLIQAGVILLAVCFATAGLFTAFHPAVYQDMMIRGVKRQHKRRKLSFFIQAGQLKGKERLRQQIIVGAGNQILLKCFQDTADGKGAGGVGAVSRTAAIGAAGIIGQLRENGNRADGFGVLQEIAPSLRRTVIVAFQKNFHESGALIPSGFVFVKAADLSPAQLVSDADVGGVAREALLHFVGLLSGFVPQKDGPVIGCVQCFGRSEGNGAGVIGKERAIGDGGQIIPGRKPAVVTEHVIVKPYHSQKQYHGGADG